MKATLSMKSAQGCAWRGRYLYLNDKQLARVTLDPNGGQKPTLTVALPYGWYRTCSGSRVPALKAARIPLPYIPWRWVAGRSRPFLAVYKASSWLYHKLDGRYGWGSKGGAS